MSASIIFFISGLIIGTVIAWLIVYARQQKIHSLKISELQAQHSQKVSEIEKELSASIARLEELRQHLNQKDADITKLREELNYEKQNKIEALTKLDIAQKSFEEQKAMIDMLKTEMIDTFNALSSAALKSSSEDFLRLASEHLGKIVAETKGKLGEHQAALDNVIKPLHQALQRYEENLRSIEENRHKAYGSLTEQIRSLASTNESLQRETSNLVSALRKPQIRGRWGEMQLRRVAELSGMTKHCDFTEQVTVDTEKGKIRPDMIVHLPMEREIVVDAKVPLDAYLEAISASNDEERKTKMEKHAQQVRSHMNKLASKEYWSQFSHSPEFVILFIPGESFLSSAIDIDSTLIEDGIQKGIIIATPTTFIALLRAIAYGWRQEQLTKNAQEISELGKQLYERINVIVQHFENIGTNLEKSVSAYNKAVGSFETRILPTVRRFKELGISTGSDISVLEQIDRNPKKLYILEDEQNKVS
ncbi:MAG: DNA recombination protein RmuC [Nitrospirae bacterium]|jgi:DNA recombination protein RmuC|nr:DNA recombination protein RmuC [Nitrospirota bacterium]